MPLLLFTKLTPPGSAPDSVMLIAAPVGNPVVMTVKIPAVPTVNVVAFPLVIAEASFTVSVKVWAGVLPTTFVAVNVRL